MPSGREKYRFAYTKPSFGTLNRDPEFASQSGGSNCCSDPSPTRAGGQDDGSYTNSLKLPVASFFVRDFQEHDLIQIVDIHKTLPGNIVAHFVYFYGK